MFLHTTAEMMARELGVVMDLQAAELLMTNTNLTLGFDSTTQEGVHINGAQINGAQINGAQINGAQINGAQINGVHINGAHISGAHINGAHINGAHINGAHIHTMLNDTTASLPQRQSELPSRHASPAEQIRALIA